MKNYNHTEIESLVPTWFNYVRVVVVVGLGVLAILGSELPTQQNPAWTDLSTMSPD